MIHINFECAKCAACTLRDAAYHAGCVRTAWILHGRETLALARAHTPIRTCARDLPHARSLARSHARTLAHTQQASNAARHIWKETERNAAMWRKWSSQKVNQHGRKSSSVDINPGCTNAGAPDPSTLTLPDKQEPLLVQFRGRNQNGDVGAE